MQAYIYKKKGKFALVEKQKSTLIEPTDAIVKVTLGSICTSDPHIKHGSVPRGFIKDANTPHLGEELYPHFVREL